MEYDKYSDQLLAQKNIIPATLKTDPNYYIQKGLEVFEAMHPSQYH